MKTKLALIFPWVVIAILLAFLLWPDKNHDTHATQHADVVTVHDTIDAHGVNYRRIIDSLSIYNYRLDSANKSLVKGQAEYKKQLNSNAAEMKTMAAQLKVANKDSALNAKIDSLIALVDNYAFLLGQYQAYSDSINTVNDSTKINYETTIKEKDKRISELELAHEKLFNAYTDLFDSSRGLMKDLKNQKLQKKVAVVIGLAGLIKGLIK